jgi:ABC-2 type transport system ATP-binding protein
VSGRLIANLSKGYQQRVGIAQAIIHSPEIVILDEPTVGLDPIQIRAIRELIRELAGDHSVILSTHILPEVQATCDRVQIINRGELVMSDTIDGLMNHMRGSSLKLALRSPPARDQLQGELQKVAAGIEQIEALGDGHFQIHFLPEHNPAEALVALSVAKGWGLYELTPATRSLEDIFVDITTTEAEVPAAEQQPAEESLA